MDRSGIPLIREAMRRLDAGGRFHADDLPHLRAVVMESREDRRSLDHPASLFGAWRELSPGARDALRRIIETDIKETMDLLPHGDLWIGLVRGAWEMDRALHEASASSGVRHGLIRWANRLSGGPLNARNRLVQALGRRRWFRGRSPGPGEMLAALGRSPQWLLGDFAAGVEVDPRARGYYLDPARNLTHAYFVGLDLIPTPRGICCLEANLEPGIVEKRRKVLQGNPIVERILDAARAHGARHVYWVEGRRLSIRTWLLSDLNELPRGSGIRLEVLEDPTLPARTSVPPGVVVPNRWALPGWFRNDSLVVRRNEFPVGPDYLVNHKEAFVRSVDRALREANETRVHVLPMTRVPEEVPEPQGPGLPNLVYKYPTSLGARGVFFLKARDAGHAMALARELDARLGEPPGLFQPFAMSVLPDGRRIFGLRVEVLVSPLGSWYLASFLRAGIGSIPEELPYGVVSSPGVFAADPAAGSEFEVVEPGMEREFSEAALAVADALRQALEGSFRTRTSRPREDPVSSHTRPPKPSPPSDWSEAPFGSGSRCR